MRHARRVATYAIGDVQGCYDPFQRLLEAVGFDPAADRLWLAGDLVNRGPASLEVLRWLVAHRAQVVSVLGNHDIYLLARALGAVHTRRRCTIQAVLDARDAAVLIGWLRARPLLHTEGARLLVHAGLHPAWAPEDAATEARAVEALLTSSDTRAFLSESFDRRPRHWRPTDTAHERALATLAILTRVRCYSHGGTIDYKYAGPLPEAPDHLTPWWRMPGRRSAGVHVYFGHWAALGFHREPGITGLDSGCVWGGALTAVRLDDGSVAQVPLDP